MKTDLSEHFRFGENWQSFVAAVDEDRIEQAVRGLSGLVPAEAIAGQSFLDIGCGSGLSMVAALRLGAAAVHGVDLDPSSVAAARELLGKQAPSARWSVEERSVFELDPAARYDIVHSWGVLHHTGEMWRAMDCAAALVAPGGLLVVALYHRTPLCALWRIEKRLYAHGPGWLQRSIRGVFKTAYVAAIAASGRNPIRYIARYRSNRGMSWHHDIHDWLGGYPYESVGPGEVRAYLRDHGFAAEKVVERPAPMAGLFGTGCDEFVARRAASA